MTAKDAYKIIKKSNQGRKCLGCSDFGDFYGFIFAPDGWDGGPFGGAYDTVDKKSGKTSTFNPVMDFALFSKAKPVELSTLGGVGVSV